MKGVFPLPLWKPQDSLTDRRGAKGKALVTAIGMAFVLSLFISMIVLTIYFTSTSSYALCSFYEIRIQ